MTEPEIPPLSKTETLILMLVACGSCIGIGLSIGISIGHAIGSAQ